MIPAVAKYLAHYAEPEARELPQIARTFGHAVVIPAYDEGDNLFATLESIPEGLLGDVLTLLVVNTPMGAPPRAQVGSQALIDKIGRRLGRESAQSGAPLFRWFAHPRGALLCLDRTGPRSLPNGQGVGLARKIGCDVALQLHLQGRLRSPWIHSTDADVQLPTGYFEAASGPIEGKPPAALIYPFWHQCEPSVALADAMQRYELYLRYYVLALADVGSPYAFHTLGSTLAIHASAYAQVRGFPKRAAAEDFYVLNKLAKVGKVRQLDGPVLLIRGRSSHRVPFGTGAALNQIRDCAARGEPYRVYAPEVFQYVKVWLAALDLLCADRGRRDLRDYLEAAAVRCPQATDVQTLHSQIGESGFVAAAAQARQISRDAPTMSRHLHTWFDAFRTLKLIHGLTNVVPKRELLEAIRAAPFLPGTARQSQSLTHLRCVLAASERDVSTRVTRRGGDDSAAPSASA